MNPRVPPSRPASVSSGAAARRDAESSEAGPSRTHEASPSHGLPGGLSPRPGTPPGGSDASPAPRRPLSSSLQPTLSTRDPAASAEGSARSLPTSGRASWDAGAQARWRDGIIAAAHERLDDPAVSYATLASTVGFMEQMLAAHDTGEEPLPVTQRVDVLDTLLRLEVDRMGGSVSPRRRRLAGELAAGHDGHDGPSVRRLLALDDRYQLLDDAQRLRVAGRLKEIPSPWSGTRLTDLPDELLLKIGDHLNPREVADRQGLRSLGAAHTRLRETFRERVDEARLLGSLLKVASSPAVRAGELGPGIAHARTLSDKTRPRPASRKFSEHTVVHGDADGFVGATSMRCDGLAVLLQHLDMAGPLHVTCHGISSIADAVESLADPLQRAHMAQRLFTALAERPQRPIDLPGRPIAAQHLAHAIEGVAGAGRVPGPPVQPAVTIDDRASSRASSISVDDAASSSSRPASEYDMAALPRQVFEQVSRIARGLPLLQQAELLPMQAAAAHRVDRERLWSQPDEAPGDAEAPLLGAQAHAHALGLFDKLHAQAVAAGGDARRDLAWGMWRALVAISQHVDDDGARLPAPPGTVERLMDLTQTLPPDRQPPLLAAVASRIPDVQPRAARAELGRRCLRACADLQPTQRSAALVHALIDMFGSAGRELGIDEFETATGLLKEMPPGHLEGGDIGATVLQRALNHFEGEDLRRALAAVREMLQDRGPAAMVRAAAPLFSHAVRLPAQAGGVQIRATLDWLDRLTPEDMAPGARPPTGAQANLHELLQEALNRAENVLTRWQEELPDAGHLFDRLDATRARLLAPTGPQAQGDDGA